MIFVCALCGALLQNQSFAQKNNTKAVQDFYGALDAGDFDKAAAYLSDDLKANLPLSPQPLDFAAYKQIGVGFKAGFPDMHHQLLETTESGNTVAGKGYFSGTNTGAMMGNPPTENRVELPFLAYFKFNTAGKINEINLQFNLAAFNAQLMAGIPSVQEMNKKATTQVMEAINNRDLDYILTTCSPGCRFNGWAPEPLDANGYKQAMSDLLASFPDARFIVDDMVAEGDKVVVRHHLQGTHTGAPFQGIPATNRAVYVPATVTIQIKDGKSVELWLNADFLGLMMQLGAIPAPTGK